jgi:hypothetical protein
MSRFASGYPPTLTTPQQSDGDGELRAWMRANRNRQG